MAKTTTSIAGSRKTRLQIESLENRQLLAPVQLLGGTYVGSQIFNQGTANQYQVDYVTIDPAASAGGTASVSFLNSFVKNADGTPYNIGTAANPKYVPNAITQVSWLDADGDIVQAQFGGQGYFGVALPGADKLVNADQYTGAGSYLQGNARITTAYNGTNDFIFVQSLGTSNIDAKYVNPASTANGIANIQSITVQNTNQSGAGTTLINAIYASNAFFSPDNLLSAGPSAGLNMGGVDAQSVSIGGIQSGPGGAQLLFGAAGGAAGGQTTFGTLNVAGGPVVAGPNGETIQTSNNFNIFVSSAKTSNGKDIPSNVINAADLKFGAGAYTGNISYASSATLTIDGATVTQAQLDVYANQFLGDVIINNGLNGLKLAAQQFGNITINGDFTDSIITTDTNNNGNDGAEVGIGNVTVTGKVSGNSSFEAATIGNVKFGSIAKDTTANAEAFAIIDAIGKGTTTGLTPKIGTITVDAGDVDLGTAPLAAVDQVGVGAVKGTSIGAISLPGNLIVDGGASLINLDAGVATGTTVGAITVAGDAKFVGGNAIFDGDSTADSVASFTAKSVTTTAGPLVVGAAGKLGAVTATGGDIDLFNGFNNATTTFGDFKATGDVLFKGNGGASAGIGNISGANVSFLNATDINAAKIGSITATKTLTFATNALNSTSSIGAITVAEDILFGTAGATVVAKTSLGDITVTDGTITGKDNSIEFNAGSIGAVKVTDSATGEATLTDVIFQANTGGIGDITLTSTGTGGFIAKSTGVLDFNSGTGFAAFGSIGKLTFATTKTGLVLDATTGFQIAAGVNNFHGTNSGQVVSIGDVSITSNLSATNTFTSGADLGFFISSGRDSDVTTNAANFISNSVNFGTAGGTIGKLVFNDLVATTSNLVAASPSNVPGAFNSFIVADQIPGLTASGTDAVLQYKGVATDATALGSANTLAILSPGGNATPNAVSTQDLIIYIV